MRLGSCVAVAVVEASSCSSDSTPSLGTSYVGAALKKKKLKKKMKEQGKCGTIIQDLTDINVVNLLFTTD